MWYVSNSCQPRQHASDIVQRYDVLLVGGAHVLIHTKPSLAVHAIEEMMYVSVINSMFGRFMGTPLLVPKTERGRSSFIYFFFWGGGVHGQRISDEALSDESVILYKMAEESKLVPCIEAK
jgi:hypothetical protein